MAIVLFSAIFKRSSKVNWAKETQHGYRMFALSFVASMRLYRLLIRNKRIATEAISLLSSG